MVFNNNLLLGAAGAGGGYTIEQSIRFNRDDDAKLTRTFGTATNRKIYTLSVWEKNGKNAGSLLEYNATGGVTWANINFGQDGRIDFFDYSGGAARIDLRTTAIYRDPSAWYHVVVAVDTTQATSTDRVKMYVNGTQITSFGTATYPSLNFDGFINSAVSHLIGDGVNGPFDGYLAEYHFIDGQALDPTSFGETNSDGVWVPIEYTGSYGTNGFYITGADSADLGADDSGNGNDFTSSGLTTTDQMLDTPTDNFCVLNPIDPATTGTLSDGNLVTSGNAKVTMRPDSGQWYYEKDGVGVSYDADTSGQFDPTLASGSYNFGQLPWIDTGPTGSEKALSTANLTDTTITTSGTFTGNASADGPFVYLNGVPTAMTINGNSVTFATHADKLANGFKVRTSSSSYNASGSNSYSISTTGAAFADNANAQGNP